jgi:hypothetical protein
VSRLGQGAAEGQKEASLSPVTLRDGGDAVSQSLLSEIRKRTEPIGIAVDEAHISHLAYSFEIAGIMLTKQAASAVVAARRLVVKGAVSIPCSDRSASPAPSRRETALIMDLSALPWLTFAHEPVFRRWTVNAGKAGRV